jgi:hypothetical protein
LPLENARAKKYNDRRDVRFFPFERAVEDAALDLRSPSPVERSDVFRFPLKTSPNNK